MLHYCSYAISSCLIGSVLGNVIGLILLPSMQFKNYSTLYVIPELKLYGYAKYVIISVIVVLVFGIGASYLSVRKTLKEVPAQCLRTAPPKKVHKILIEKIPFVWNSLSHRGKLIARNIFLNKKSRRFAALRHILYQISCRAKQGSGGIRSFQCPQQPQLLQQTNICFS